MIAICGSRTIVAIGWSHHWVILLAVKVLILLIRIDITFIIFVFRLLLKLLVCP